MISVCRILIKQDHLSVLAECIYTVMPFCYSSKHKNFFVYDTHFMRKSPCSNSVEIKALE